MPPLLRFFHIKNINPGGWISIPTNKLRNIQNEHLFNCDLLYEVNYDFIESSNKLNIGKLSILSWDIEADSEYGDFPQPIKEYHKQAKDIVEYFYYKIQNKEQITKQHIYHILQKMLDYKFDELDIKYKSDLERISKIYFKNNIVKLVKRDLKIKTGKTISHENVCNYILQLHDKIFNICEKYKNKNFSIDKTNNTIDTFFKKNNYEYNNILKEEFNNDSSVDSEDDTDIMEQDSNIKTNKDFMIYKINKLLLTKIGKYVRGDRLTQIGAVFQVYGDTNYDKFILTLGSCSNYDTDCIIIDTKNKSNSNIITEALSYNYEYTKIISFYDTEEYDNYNNKILDKLEKNVILAYKELILQYDPDIILAYNNYGFDNQFIMKRAQELNIIEEFSNISKINEYKCELKEKNLSSAALGDNILQLIDTPGRVHIDLLKVVQRDFKLESYKLDNVAEHFLGEHKDDVSANQIFEYQKLDRHHRGIIAKYCVQDCVLLLNLIAKLNICSNNIGMANVCSIPLSFIFLRGQGIKIQSLVGKFCLDKDVLLKTLDKSGTDDSYEGAVVLPPTIGMYIKKAVAVLDYASLYPSSMIGSNISQDSKVYSEMTEYESLDQIMNLDFSDMRQQLTFKNLEKYLLKKYDSEETNQLLYEIPIRYKCYPLLDSIYIPEINKRYIRFKNIYKLYKQSRDNPTNNPNLNIKNFDYMDIYFDTYKGTGDKKYKTGIKKVTYASNTNGTKGILPQILQFLLSQRKAVRKKIPLEQDPFKKDILEGYQLAYKLCANSLYGQTGSSTSVISDIDLASSTTAIGRQMLSLCKSFGEQYYKANVVYGDTDSIFNIYHESVFQSKYNNENNLLALLNEHLDKPINLENNDKLTNEIRDLIENMNQVPGKIMLKISILRSIILSNEIATLLRPPHDLEYEKTFAPFILFSKKRYVGNLYELDPGKGKLKYMGIVLKRRDNANIVKMIYKDIIEKIMYENNIEASIEYLQECLNNLLDGKYKIEDLTITKTLRGFYKNRSMIAHAVLADRIGKRTGEKVPSNTRIPYVYICVPEKKGVNILQGKRIETPEHILENKLKIDYGYYITNQLMKPIIQIYDLIMKEPDKIFEDALRKSNNHKNNFKEISNWFKPVNNTTLKTKIKIEKGCVYVIQKSKSVQQKCNRDCVANSNFCKKHIKI